MAQEIEIEFKNLLTEEEYLKLLSNLPFPKYSQTQTNYYFETEDFSLKAHGSALRIREKNGNYTLTLKEPHELGLLETHDALTEDEAAQWLNNNFIAKENIQKQLASKSITLNELHYCGKLETRRHETSYRQVQIVLDHSIYNGSFDYEFELEAADKETGTRVFQEILDEYHIQRKTTANKIERFFNSLKSSSD